MKKGGEGSEGGRKGGEVKKGGEGMKGGREGEEGR